MIKNVGSQKIAVFAWDSGAGAPKTGDAANITGQISLDGGVSGATNDVNPTQLDATNHPGVYLFDLTQAETNADLVVITPRSTTAGVVFKPVVAYPTSLTPTKSGYLDAAVSTRSTLTAPQVWEYGTRTLSSFGTLAADVWTNGTRTLSSFGSLVADAAAAVWSSVTRSLTDKAGFAISGTKQTLDALNDATQGATKAELDAAQASIEGAMPDVSGLAVEENVEGHVTAALTAYDPPTRAEATADKEEVMGKIPDAVDLTALTALVTRSLGLAGENLVMDQTVFDPDHKLTSARVRIYDSAAHALAAGDNGVIATFPLTMTWASRLLESMTQVIT